MPNAEKDVTPIGRYIHPQTPCETCVPYRLMPINTEAYSVFSLCRNAVMRQHDGKPYDADMNTLANTIIALGYGKNCLREVADLMRELLHEEIL